MHSRNSFGAVALVVLFVTASLAGCVRQGEFGSRPNADDPTAGVVDAPEARGGHAIETRRLSGSAAAVAGIAADNLPTGRLTFRLGPEPTSLAEHRALVLHDARVQGVGVGVLIALADRDFVIDGPVGYSANAVAVTRDELTYRVAEDPAARVRVETSEALQQALDESGFGSTVFFAETLAMRTRGFVQVEAERLVLVDEDGAHEVGSTAVVERAGVVAASAVLDEVGVPDNVFFEITSERGAVVVANATATIVLAEDDEDVRDVKGNLAFTLGAPTNVSIMPPQADDPSAEVVLDVRGRAYQIYAEGRALLQSSLTLTLDSSEVIVPEEGAVEVKMRLRNNDPNTDAVIGSVNVTGAPEGAVRMPGFSSVTAEAFAAFADHPAALAAVALASPALVVLDAWLLIVDAIFGPPPIPQVVNAGTTFTTALSVTKPEGAFDAAIDVGGNFDATRATLAVR